MEFDTLFKALGILAAFLSLYLTAVKVRRDEKLGSRKALLNDIEILEKLKNDSFYYERVRAQIKRAILSVYRPHKVYHRAMGVGGLVIYLGSATYGVYLFFEKSDWFWFWFLVTVVSLEFQRRSLLPGGMVEPPEIEIKQSDT